ncbi:MAG: hypothetical protein WAS73_17095, partial [Defluviicoccus sp.]
MSTGFRSFPLIVTLATRQPAALPLGVGAQGLNMLEAAFATGVRGLPRASDDTLARVGRERWRTALA